MISSKNVSASSITTQLKEEVAITRAFMSFRILPSHWLSDERFENLMTFLQKHRKAADEVAFFTAAIHPALPLAVIEERCAILTQRITAAKKAGYRAGINHLGTLGHIDEYLHYALKGDYTPLMDVNGTQAVGCFCPNCENVRDYTRMAYSAVAEARPDFIWLDDDIRMGFHPPALHPCFCGNCLRIFNKKNAGIHTRESLQKAFDQGTLHEKRKIRLAWLEHNANSIDRLLHLIEKTVHAILPDLPLGLMAAEHFYEQYDFEGNVTAMSGPRNAPVMWRPGGGFYSDETMNGLIDKSHAIGRQVSRLPMQVINIQSEIENFPYQPLKKAASTTVLEAASHIAAGCMGAAYNVLGILDENPNEYQPLMKKLVEARPFLDLLVQTLSRSRLKGIRTGWNANSYLSNNLKSGKWFEGGDWIKNIHENASEILQMGLPAAYAEDDAAVTILLGDLVLAMQKKEIERVLTEGVYLDGVALTHLNDMGYGSLTGFVVEDWVKEDCAEILTNDPLNGKFAGRRRDCVQAFWDSPCAKLTPVDSKGRILARNVERTENNTSFPCMGVYINSLGGRVAVAGYAPWSHLQSLPKAMQIKNLFRWLSNETLVGYVESYHKINIWIRQFDKEKIAIVLINSSMDTANNVSILLKTSASSISLYNMKCVKNYSNRSGTDGLYARFNLPPIQSWSMLLAIAEE